MKKRGKKYKIRICLIKYLIVLIDKHGIDILKTSKNKVHPKYDKKRNRWLYFLLLLLQYDRIKTKLKGLPVKFVLQSLNN